MSTEVLAPDTDIVHVEQTAIGAITKSEIESQLDAAHKYPRSIKRFLDEAIGLATFSEEIAASCIYSLPRGKDDAGNKKVITGPSVRLAEICMSAYGNIHAGARVVGAEDKDVLSQGVAWDLEKNVRVTIEKRRKILDKNGRRYNEDMINVTANAAASIGLRDAIFRVIPRAYVNAVYDRAKEVAVGKASTLTEKRAKMFDGFSKLGIHKERVLAVLERTGIEDVTLTDLETLIGLANAIKDGSVTLDEAFPPAVDLSKKQQTSGSAIDRIVADRNAQNKDMRTVDPHTKPEGPSSTSASPKDRPEPSASTAPSGPDPTKGWVPATPTGKPAPPKVNATAPAGPASEVCDKSAFDNLEILGTECGVGPRRWKKHISETMGFTGGWEFLTKDRLVEVQNWIRANRTKPEDGQ